MSTCELCAIVASGEFIDPTILQSCTLLGGRPTGAPMYPVQPSLASSDCTCHSSCVASSMWHLSLHRDQISSLEYLKNSVYRVIRLVHFVSVTVCGEISPLRKRRWLGSAQLRRSHVMRVFCDSYPVSLSLFLTTAYQRKYWPLILNILIVVNIKGNRKTCNDVDNRKTCNDVDNKILTNVVCQI